MCGITGFLDARQEPKQQTLETLVVRMSNTIRHRGPDDSGHWVDAEYGLALGFRRLAILDLSPTGHQPMLSADERFVIIFNGEIYNFKELGEQLASLGVAFRGTSDTEVILAAFSAWGIPATVRRLNGMFAFAAWDRREKTLHLVRDRLGIKPLYYGWQGATFLFGSELKALRAHPAFQAEIDREALTLYLRHNYIPAPHSIYEGIFKLPPACILTLDTQNPARDAAPQSYWSAREVAESGLTDPRQCGDHEAIDALDAHLRRSVGLRMIADVPLGAFLSGGIDSSTVVALMQTQSDRPVKTYTIGFFESGFDEAQYAKAVAKHLGTDHTELYVTPEEARSVIPLLPSLYDEPFSDSSQIPTFLVSQLARKYVTVSLSGDGGDELFGGYNRYSWTTKIWKNIGWIPGLLRNRMADLIQGVSPASWAKRMQVAGRIFEEALTLPNAGDKFHRLSEIMRAPNQEAIYLDLVSHWKDPASIVLNGDEPSTPLTDPAQWLHTDRFTEQMMYLDLITYLPGDILTKLDRASMGNSLEARAPFLDDHETVEFAWRLPLNMKVRNGQGKWILRQVLYKYVPQEIMERPKMGFGVPIDAWLRGDLREWAESLLDAGRLHREGFFEPEPIRTKWREHLSGDRNWQYYLWDILMFQAWLENSGH